MNGHRISVAICTFNGANFIEPQLESILSQSRPPDEVIICDDASTDNTINIVQRITSQCPITLRIIQNEKRLGIIKNFEKAIRCTTGDIIFLCDQDDVWFKEKIDTLSAPFVENDKIGLVYGNAILTDATLRQTNYTLFNRRRYLQLNNERLAYQLVAGVGINGCTMSFRASLKDFILPLSEEWGHDHWIAFIAHAVMDTRAIEKPLMFYRRHGHNFGIDPHLEGGWVNKWRAGLKTSGIEVYAKDRRHWEVMFQRLKEISRSQILQPENHFRINDFLRECEQRLEFARLRERLKQVRRLKRIAPLLDALLKDNYHRYLRGMKSFTKDMLIG